MSYRDLTIVKFSNLTQVHVLVFLVFYFSHLRGAIFFDKIYPSNLLAYHDVIILLVNIHIQLTINLIILFQMFPYVM